MNENAHVRLQGTEKNRQSWNIRRFEQQNCGISEKYTEGILSFCVHIKEPQCRCFQTRNDFKTMFLRGSLKKKDFLLRFVNRTGPRIVQLGRLS